MSPVVRPTHKSVVLHGPKDLRVEHRLVWPPTANQAQVSIVSTGLCGSDLHYYINGRNGDFVIKDPLVLGHEASGIVTALGSNVTHLKIGQRVAIECGIPCNNTAPDSDCSHCKSGRYNLCPKLRFCSSAKTYPHLDGTLQNRINHPANLLHPIPDNVSYEQAALAEPLSVLIHASRRASLEPGQTVLVFGVGAIGLLACALARSHGARRIVAIDINEKRLDFAKREGFADAVYNCMSASTAANNSNGNGNNNNNSSGSVATAASTANTAAMKSKATISPPSASTSSSSASSSSSSTPAGNNPPAGGLSGSGPAPAGPALDAREELLRRAKDNIGSALKTFHQPDGFDVVFECTGAELCIQMSVFAAATGGKVMLVGMGSRNVTLPISTAATREVDILGSFRYANTYPEALALLSGTWSPVASSIPKPWIPSIRPSPSSVSSHRHPHHHQTQLDSRHSTSTSSTKKWDLASEVTKLVTHRVGLDETDRAFRLLEKGVDENGRMVLKIMVEGRE